MEIKSFFAQDQQGNTIANPAVHIFSAGTTTLVSGLQDASGNSMANPFTGNENGHIQFAAPNGDYDMRVSSTMRNFTMRVRFVDVYEQEQAASSAAANAVEQAEIATAKAAEALASAEEAAVSKNAADASQSAAAESANTATTKATEAAASASSAATSASSALSSKTTAVDRANAAAASAQEATATLAQTQYARDQALAGLGAADNSQILSVLMEQLMYAIDQNGLTTRDLLAYKATVDARLAGFTTSEQGIDSLATYSSEVMDLIGVTARTMATCVKLVGVPANASAYGQKGDFAWDASYLYICTAANTWKRVAIATW